MKTSPRPNCQAGHRTARASYAIASLVLAGSAMMLGGCSTDVNSRVMIGAERVLPALAGPGADAAIDQQVASRLDRGDWTPIDFRVPIDGTVHNALLKTEPVFGDDHPRAHGLFPTRESALDLGASSGSELARGVIEPVRALVDLAIMPVRSFTDPAWGKRQSPSNYKRWHPGEWLAGPMPADADGANEAGEP